jgi:Putative peptidoglycan binding domain
MSRGAVRVSPLEHLGPAGGRRLPGPRWIAAGLVAVLLAGAAAGAVALSRRSAPTAAARPMDGGVATVRRMDLTTSQQVPGTIGYGSATTVAAPGGSAAAATTQAQGAASTASQKLAADQQAAADVAAVNRQTLAQAQATVDADQATLAADQQAQQQDQQKLQDDQRKQQADCPASPACAADQSAVAQDQQRVSADARTVSTDSAKLSADRAAQATAGATAQQKANAAQAQVGADQVAVANANAALQPAQSQSLHGTVYTGLPSVGDLVDQGQALYSVDGHPVPLFFGAISMYRRLAPGVTGPDVQQLEQNLLKLGYASSSNLAADGSYSAQDAAAVRRWQAAIGAPQTGEVWLGDVVFLPGKVRVTGLHALAGAQVAPGQPVLDVTPATRVVTVQLNSSLGYSVKQGDHATIDLPDGKTRLPGTVTAVSTVAQQVQGSSAQTQNGAPQTTIPVTIAPDDPSRLPNLDSAPVTVDVTTQSAKGVLAVPVNALLATAGGGYALEVIDPDGRSRLVPVQVGIFDSSLVEVSGPGLAEGVKVGVPAS